MVGLSLVRALTGCMEGYAGGALREGRHRKVEHAVCNSHHQNRTHAAQPCSPNPPADWLDHSSGSVDLSQPCVTYTACLVPVCRAHSRCLRSGMMMMTCTGWLDTAAVWWGWSWIQTWPWALSTYGPHYVVSSLHRSKTSALYSRDAVIICLLPLFYVRFCFYLAVVNLLPFMTYTLICWSLRMIHSRRRSTGTGTQILLTLWCTLLPYRYRNPGILCQTGLSRHL